MANKSVKTNEYKGQTKAVDIYLIAYNGIQTLGWSYLLYQLITFYLLSDTNKSLYDTVKCTVASRVIVVCGVLMATKAPRESIGLTFALTAWSITEIVRYATYTLNLLNIAPFVLKWLRYTLFIGLYPLGVTGELLCIYACQREVGDGQLYSVKMPNSYNFIFNYQHLLWFIMLLYIPLFPQLYLHMFSQRRKVLGRTSKKDA